MKIFVPKETHPGERRVPMIPGDVAKLVKRGAEVIVETGMGESCGHNDGAYTASGAAISADRKSILSQADMVVRLRKPHVDEIPLLKKGSVHVSHLDPFNEKELVTALVSSGVSAICMEMIPRTTIAQKMDALSSQASLGGYAAVILAAQKLDKVFPMMMTPSGTITPSRVFIVGAGVAGLQAIATAKRLGARVDAFDTRPVVKEQVLSLGAKFVEIDLGETGQTSDGYARALTEEQIRKQREGMAKVCAQSDVIITTAQVFGKKAPVIITKEMVAGMKPGSIIIDMAVETGGNVEGSVPGKEVDVNGVRIIGITNLPGEIPFHASQMYSANVTALIEHFWNNETKSFEIRLDDDIIKGCLVTHASELRNEMLKAHYAGR